MTDPETPLTARLRYMIGANGNLPPLEARALCEETERLAAEVASVRGLVSAPFTDSDMDWSDSMKVYIFNLLRAKLWPPAAAPAPATDRPTPAHGVRASIDVCHDQDSRDVSSARANDCEQGEGA